MFGVLVSFYPLRKREKKGKKMSNALQEIIEDVFDYECCEAKLPKKMSVGFSHFGGAYVAKCSKCSYVCAYWECACELRHDCGAY